MSQTAGNVYKVKRLEDGAVVPLTCTEEQLQEWLKNGYELIEEGAENASTGTTRKSKG